MRLRAIFTEQTPCTLLYYKYYRAFLLTNFFKRLGSCGVGWQDSFKPASFIGCMSTYEFQISITPDNYQTQSSLEDQHIPHQIGLGAVESPEPVIIPYDASHPRPPYGSGDEGFNLTFNNIDDFFAWKESEEAKQYATL